MNKKWTKRPQYGLQIKRIRKILGNKKTEELIDLYMEEKKNELLRLFEKGGE